MTVALGSVETTIIGLLASALVAALIWLAGRGIVWFGAHTKLLTVQQQAAVQALFSETMMKVSVYGVGAATGLVHAHGWDSVQVKDAALAAGITYAADKFPDVLAQVGIDPSDQASVANGVTGALNRLFPQAVAIVSASPATPDAGITAASVAASSAA